MHSAEKSLRLLFCVCLGSTLLCLLFFALNRNEEGSVLEDSETGVCWPPRDRETEGMSVLGKWLLAPEDTEPPAIQVERKEPFLILVWNYGPFLERRHIRHFTDKKFLPWTNCTVSNCLLSYKYEDLERADAVLFHLHLTKGPAELPVRRNYDQIWIFLTDESPVNSFVYKNQKLSDYNGLFNWSMTYRMNSDVPVPYGRTVLTSSLGYDSKTINVPSKTDSYPDGRFLQKDLLNEVLYNKSKVAAVLISNCAARNRRWALIQEIKSYLGEHLDIFGGCSGLVDPCPGHFGRDCEILESYRFYLAFENSNCVEYLTEKVFWNAYRKRAVPVVFGPSKRDCEKLLPPNSFIHLDDFTNAKDLAQYLLFLDKNTEAYLEFHSWRNCYKVINEHGYFGSQSMHYCRICQALNYNPRERKVYDSLETFWSVETDCQS